MTGTWSPDDLERIGSARELQIAVKRDDGTLRRWVPIWVVLVDEQIYVRTWYRRETGWFWSCAELAPGPYPRARSGGRRRC